MSEKIILDVRTPEEYKAERIKDSIDIPLSFIESREDRVAKLLKWKEVIIICRSWRRAELAKKILAPHSEIEKLKVYKWGILEYKKQHPKEIISSPMSFTFPIMRQVQIIAGWLILLFSILGFVLNSYFFLGSLWVWAWLFFAGISGFCGMATLLSYAPWNK